MDNHLLKKALFLSWFTIGYNILEGVLSIFFGMLAGSVALVGFGLDSFVESLSGGVMVWRISGFEKTSSDEEERKERRALTLIGWTFFILAAYVVYESVKKLYLREAPEESLPGIIIAAVSAIAMPILYVQKKRTGIALGMRSLIADSKETLACTFLSISLLIGLGLNYLLGWWWADPLTGLVVAYFLFNEGKESLETEEEGEE